MTHSDLLEWCVPLLLACLGTMFYFLKLPFGRSLGAAYFLSAVGFTLAIFPVPATGGWIKVAIEDFFFLSGIAAFAHVLALRSGVHSPIRTLTILTLFGTALAAVAIGYFDSLRLEAAGTTAICAVFTGIAAFALSKRMVHQIDKLLFAATVLFALNLVAQITNIVLSADAHMTVTEWRDSPWAFALQLMGAIFGLVFAFIFILAIGLDVLETLRSESETDSLSGLLNRRGFTNRMDQRRHEVGVLLIADLDHFKRINDRYGHDAGDCIIAGIGTLITGMAGKDGFGARLGGEEFAVFMPSLLEPEILGERLRDALMRTRWPHPLNGVEVTISIGATRILPDESLPIAYRRADSFLYAAKDAGRNRVFSDGNQSAGFGDGRKWAIAAQ
ncbi:GGDEF domain-containing protein [Fulvimarina manganoxydans]|uniref:GGDEF domain-containing protein n=1 Tax=Fulvimarina manganoxydans TaxID=937218 RepID=UPI002352A21E|nr:GGDEF domain-containing protein [Fulvimarina manganoxydans]